MSRKSNVDKTTMLIHTRPSGAELEKIIKLWEQGLIKPVVQTVMPLDEGAKAFELLEDGHTKGKIILKVSS